jgi:thymidine phosphorylase
VDVLAKPGAKLAAGDPLLVLHYRHERDLKPAVDLAARAIAIDDEAPVAAPLVRGRIGTGDGV